MTAYLLSIMGTVLLCAVLTAILPEGKTTVVIKGITKLVCILVITAPILHFFQFGIEGEFSDIFFSESVIQTDGEFIQYYSEMRMEYTEVALRKELNELYNVQADVRLVWENEGESGKIFIQKIYVKINQNVNEEVKANMCDYLSKNYCSEVLIE